MPKLFLVLAILGLIAIVLLAVGGVVSMKAVIAGLAVFIIAISLTYPNNTD